jgi:hypothetical protein
VSHLWFTPRWLDLPALAFFVGGQMMLAVYLLLYRLV